MMNSTNLIDGISQNNSFSPKKEIILFGNKYILCKDASDSTTFFPHNRVKIQSGDCIKIPDIDAFFCYMHGVIPPMPNSLEKSVDVYYIGFHKNYVDMRYLTPTDISRMHIYKTDTTDWASAFAKAVLDIEPEIPNESLNREPISPWVPTAIIPQHPEFPQQEKNLINTGENMESLNSPNIEQKNTTARRAKG